MIMIASAQPQAERLSFKLWSVGPGRARVPAAGHGSSGWIVGRARVQVASVLHVTVRGACGVVTVFHALAAPMVSRAALAEPGG